MRLRDALRELAASLGIASICSLPSTAPLLSANHLLLYHLPGDASAAFCPALLKLLALWIFFAGCSALAALARAACLAWPATLDLALLALVPAAMLRDAIILWAWRFRGDAIAPFAAGLLALLVLGAARHRHRARADALVRSSRTVLAFAGLFGALSIAQMLLTMRAARDLNPPPALASALSRSPDRSRRASGNERIVWLLFDELSYEQLYGRRAAGLNLPAFDALRAQSVVFADARPAGYYTERVLPALMTGRPVARIRSTVAGGLWTQSETGADWQAFRPSDTVFADAKDRGLRVGIAGWYNPYCRILPGLLDQCFWADHDAAAANFLPSRSPLANAMAWLARLGMDMRRVFSHRGEGGSAAIAPRLADYRDLIAASDSMLRDPSLTFVFLHLPLPHPPGFYNRRVGAFAAGGTYLDNLALADKTLAHLRDLLAQQGEWDSSTIVLMGDHSWRVDRWKSEQGWTAEEERASGGRFDDRPAYLVKLPNEARGFEVATPFPALRTRELFDHLFDGSIASPEDLKAWASAQTAQAPQPRLTGAP